MVDHNDASENDTLVDAEAERNASIDTDVVTDEQGRAEVDPGHPDAPLDGANASLEVEEGSEGPPTPRFLQDERSVKKWKHIPYPLRRISLAMARWAQGPPNPRPFRVKPFFPQIQEYPLKLVHRFLPTAQARTWFYSGCFALWIILFVLVKLQETIAADVAGWGQAQPIGCGDTYWSSGNGCGLDGNDCRPFNDSGFAFICPADCSSYHALNPRAVGDQEVIYRSLVIGGPTSDVHPELATYRGDSFLCGAAIHAGIISDKTGGCGVVQLVGQQQNFISTQRNGILSVNFDSYFPLAFRFAKNIHCSSKDQRWSLLAISAVFTGLLSLSTTSPALFFFPSFIGIFWTVGMGLDQPTHSSLASLFSNVLGKFLPAMFCAWVMYDRMGIRRTLKGLTAQIEKSILWLGPCWVGAMDNYTLSFIPIQRLNKHDLEQQPGARAALAMIIIILATIMLSQAWLFRQEGRFVKYFKLYALFISSLLLSLALPGLSLRIHHYILALLLLPGTSIQSRPSLLYQGLLVGLFINGIARWGFDPVLQTPGALQGDAQKGSPLPVVPAPVIHLGEGTDSFSNITFKWEPPPVNRFDGISILVNDVERFRSYFADTMDQKDEFVWIRNTSLGLPEYFRFAYMDGGYSGDYTKAGTWTAEGEWEVMKPGASQIQARHENREEGRRLQR